MPSRILFYSPYGEWYLHTLYEITIAHALKLRGAEFKFIGCDAVFSDCDQHWEAASPRTEQSCTVCREFQNRVFSNLQIEPVWLSDKLDNNAKHEVDDWVNSLQDHELLNADFKGYKLGNWVESSVHSFYRIKELDFNEPRIVKTYRSFLSGAALACLALNKYFDEFKPDVLMLLNGRFFSHRVAFEIARERGVTVYTHERGRTDNTLRIYKDETFLTFNTLAESWEAWKEVPLTRQEMQTVDKIMEERAKGINTGWKSFVRGDKKRWEDFFSTIKAHPDDKIVTLFTSSDDEAGVSKAWLPHIIDQFEWINRTIEYFKNKPEYKLVIRVHPNTIGHTGVNFQFLKKIIDLKKKATSQVHIVMPQDNVNSYQLLEVSEAVLTYFSSLSLEAVLRGKPALVCSKGLFYNKGFAESLLKADEYESKLDSVLRQGLTKEQLRAAYRYAYHYFVRQSIPFSKVETVNVHHAKITYDDLSELLPGKDKDLDHICKAILERKSVIPEPTGNHSSGAETKYLKTKLMEISENESAKKSEFQSLQGALSKDENGPSEPKVSVIVTCYNYEKYLREAVESVLYQTFQDFEIIIVNDGSTDNSAEVAKQLIAEYPNDRIILIDQENSGQPAIARNNGIKKASGKYILPLDADDKFKPDMLHECVKLLDEHPEIAIVYTDRHDFDGVDEIVHAGEYDFERLKYANHISYCGMYRKEVWEKVGGYRTNVRGVEDWDFWIAAGALGFFGKRISKPLHWYRRHDTGVYQDVLKDTKRKFAQIVLNNKHLYSSADIEQAERLLSEKKNGSPTASAKVSVIVPTFNRPKFLRIALQSIADQYYENIETVVVNDCGDDVQEIIDEFGDKMDIVYIRNATNMGLAASRNQGIKAATGKYIAYLDDDDVYLPSHVSTLVDFLERSDFKVAYSSAYAALIRENETGYDILRKNVEYRVAFDKNRFLIHNYIPVLCVMHEKSCLESAGMFDEQMTTHEDWDLWIRMSGHFDFHYVDKITAIYTRNQNLSNMTNYKLYDFLRTMKIIYNKYPSFGAQSAIIEKQRKKNLHNLILRINSLFTPFIHDIENMKNSGEYDKAEAMLREKIEEYPEATIFYNELGKLLRERGKSEEAEAQFALAKRMDELDERTVNFPGGKISGGADIVIVTYNSVKTISACLSRLDKYLRASDKVIIVDNASTDDTVNTVQNFIKNKKGYSLLINDRNEGFTRGVNIGIQEGNNPYVVLLNPDVYVTENWLEKLLVPFADTEVAAVGPISNYAAGKQNAGLYYRLENEKISVEELARQIEEQNRNKTVEAELLIGFCMMLSRDVLNRTGLLDERLFLGNDDLELSWRLRLNGYKLLVAVDTFVFHEGQVSFKSEKKSKTDRLVEESTDALYAKLEEYYGKGKVPPPESLWGISWFKPSRPEFNASVSFTDVKEIPGPDSLYQTSDGPVSKRMTSIIILTHNQLEYTEQCLNSIKEHTRAPYEIIVVDNGSSDGTVKYLQKKMKDEDNVKVIFNEDNKGFPAGCNRGMSEASGDYLLLLNNDVVVTESWLTNLLKAFDRDPALGIVGPMTNAVSGPQKEPEVTYCNMEEMHEFAGKYARINEGKLLYFPRIVGFALLMKREVFDKVGYMEESFGSGNYEDDDYCLRAEAAGYKAAIVKDVFIHHYGSITFRSKGKENYVASLESNSDLFYEKWKGKIHRPLLSWFIFLINKAQADKEKDPARALEMYREAFTIKQDEKKVTEEYCELLMVFGKTNEAVAVLREYLQHKPDDHEAINYLGTLYWQTGDLDKAEEHFAKAALADNSNLDYLKNLADVYLAKDNFTDGMNLLQHILQKDPADKESVLKLAHLYVEMEKNEEAETLFGTLQKYHPDDDEVRHFRSLLPKKWLYLTYVFLNDGKVELAQEAVTRYLQESPGDEEGLLLAAGMELYNERLDVAEKIYEKVLEKNESMEAVFYLAKIAFTKNNYDRFAELRNKFPVFFNEQAELRKMLIEILLEENDVEEALRQLDSFIGDFPEDAFGYLVMGNLYRETGEPQKALRFYGLALEKSDDDPEILEIVSDFMREYDNTVSGSAEK